MTIVMMMMMLMMTTASQMVKSIATAGSGLGCRSKGGSRVYIGFRYRA